MNITLKIQETLIAINNIEESRKGGWIHNSKLNISIKVLMELIDKNLIEPGGVYSRLTQRSKDTLAVREN